VITKNKPGKWKKGNSSKAKLSMVALSHMPVFYHGFAGFRACWY
jgi:hypothetical protein